MTHDIETNISFDFNPTLFRHLLEQLRHVKRHPSSHFSPPHSSSPFAVRSFNRMLKVLGLHGSRPLSNGVVVMNVGGDRIVTRLYLTNQSIQLKILTW